MSSDDLKAKAAHAALELVEPDMRLGLGSGSTAARFVTALGERVRDGLNVVAVPTSEDTRALAVAEGIPLKTLDDLPFLDLTVDGTDEIDDDMRLIKGGGGALLREKIVAMASERMVVIAEASKRVRQLGRFPLPVEVVPFGINVTKGMIETLAVEAGCNGPVNLRTTPAGTPFVTDNGNHIFDCAFSRIPDPDMLAHALQVIPGVVEHGLFIGIADLAILASPDGLTALRATDPDVDGGENGA